MSKQVTWGELHKRFLELTKKLGGPSKSSSGNIQIHFNYTWGEKNELIPQILIEMGAYDIPNYPRHYTLGKGENRYGPIPFTSEEEALEALASKLDEMEMAIDIQKELDEMAIDVQKELDEDGIE